ncbi:hypothetical protein [Halobacterium bonnevillei]|uniref:Phosphatidate cytidylyltransferase n=1 Tax=Halobacterium bonnevillei TaxID=2692200 RepID=A0A6B0SG16_9EURY|nr:hypothetical protein [Halobacterium bonnevillei]MXR20518.1 hypothetical protein [Halobacterium bonnevillei]
MTVSPTTLSRLGAWGQIGVVALAVVFWSLGLVNGFLAACVGYLIVTVAGIVGIARTESTIAGPLVYPFIVPGFVPLYYFATQ